MEAKRKELIGSEGKVLLDMVRRLNRRGAKENLTKLVAKTHPADMVWVYRHLTDEERAAVFEVIVKINAVGAFLSELDSALVQELVEGLTPQYMADIIADMPSDDAVDLLEILPEEMAEQIRHRMEKHDREEVEDLLQYDPESAGGLMSPDFMALDEECTAKEAIASIQKRSSEKEMVFYLYLTHGEQKLSGVISLRELLMHPPERPLKEIMNPNVVSVTTDTEQGEVASVVSKYNFLAVPVVDSNYTLMGIVTVDDIIDVIREEASEEFLQMAGAGKDREILLKSTKESALIRAPWLFASWIGGVMAMFIIGAFEEELAKVLALASFIPVVIGMGGNIATQSSTIIVRGIATGRVNLSQSWKVIVKEMQVGVLLGLLYGTFLGLVAFIGFRNEGPMLLGLVVGLSIFCCMIMSATLGTLIPLILKRFEVDAAIATGPFVTTSIDILGVLLYFSMAKIFLHL